MILLKIVSSAMTDSLYKFYPSCAGLLLQINADAQVPLRGERHSLSFQPESSFSYSTIDLAEGISIWWTVSQGYRLWGTDFSA